MNTLGTNPGPSRKKNTTTTNKANATITDNYIKYLKVKEILLQSSFCFCFFKGNSTSKFPSPLLKAPSWQKEVPESDAGRGPSSELAHTLFPSPIPSLELRCSEAPRLPLPSRLLGPAPTLHFTPREQWLHF